jgi:hypothetical protein
MSENLLPPILDYRTGPKRVRSRRWLLVGPLMTLSIASALLLVFLFVRWILSVIGALRDM